MYKNCIESCDRIINRDLEVLVLCAEGFSAVTQSRPKNDSVKDQDRFRTQPFQNSIY